MKVSKVWEHAWYASGQGDPVRVGRHSGDGNHRRGGEEQGGAESTKMKDVWKCYKEICCLFTN